MSEATQLLNAIEAGDPHACARQLPLVYQELRRLAAQRLAQERPGQTLEPTALVHEAYLRLVGEHEERHWNGRNHFFAAAAEAMRRILIDRARARNAAKRGAGRRVDLESDCLVSPPRDDAVEALDDALSRLALSHPQFSELVQLRYFGGLTLAQCAEVLGVSARTADTWWAYARAWLAVELKEN